jgi:serine/threonine protein kinase
MIDHKPNGRFYENGIHISDWGIPCWARFELQGQTLEVPGTFAYLAPEIRNGGAATTMTDIWAVGCIGYELCLGRKLSEYRQHLKEHVEKGQLDITHLNTIIADVPPRFGNGVRQVIRSCLTWNPAHRATAAALRTYILREGGV